MNLDEVQSDLNIEFQDHDLLHEALTHASCMNEPNIGYKRHNEALAWLGDALIHWVVSERMYCGEPSKKELHNRRQKYVKKTFLADLAIKYRLDRGLIMPERQVKEGGRVSVNNLHTVFEAIVGAIFKDQGFKVAEDFIVDKVITE